MEAANRGAYEAGGKTMGLNIRLPSNRRPTGTSRHRSTLSSTTFFMRKLWFAYLSKALVVFPAASERWMRCSKF